MNIPLRETIELLKAKYPAGTVIELQYMNDKQAPPVGTKGTVWGIDDMGHLLVRWETGSSLNVVLGIDQIKVIAKH